jgi:hypothetical protein
LIKQPTCACGLFQSVRYRVRQFFRALTARVLEEELKQAAGILTPASLALFRSMATQDQRHGLDVCAALQRAGHSDPDLLAASLLHDVGKSAGQLFAWHRAIIVLLGRFGPCLLARLSRGEPDGWRRPFVIHARHPEVGARWAQEAGCRPLTVALIRRHEEPVSSCRSEGGLFQSEDELLAALQAADNRN